MKKKKTMNRTLLFIPMYNCEKQIVRVLDQLDERVCAYLEEVVIVNNRSTDGGEKAVVSYLKKRQMPISVKLLRNDENYSLGGSHKVAFSYAIEHGFDYVIVLHGDDQGDIHDLLPYLKSGRAYKYDSFLGSRFERDSVLVNYSAFRIMGNHIFNIFMTMITGRRVTDLGSGLNMYRVNYLKTRFFQGFTDTLTFNVYMLLYGIWSRSRFAFFPLSWREDDQVSNAKFLRQSLEIIAIAVRYFLLRGIAFGAIPARSYSSRTVYDSGLCHPERSR